MPVKTPFVKATASSYITDMFALYRTTFFQTKMYVIVMYNFPMTNTHELPHTSRINMRLSSKQREIIDKAVKLKGMTLSQWAIEHLVEDAQSEIEQQTIRYISNESFEKFLELLDEPPSSAAQALLERDPEWL